MVSLVTYKYVKINRMQEIEANFHLACFNKSFAILVVLDYNQIEVIVVLNRKQNLCNLIIVIAIVNS